MFIGRPAALDLPFERLVGEVRRAIEAIDRDVRRGRGARG
jgi:hypothetical protein